MKIWAQMYTDTGRMPQEDEGRPQRAASVHQGRPWIARKTPEAGEKHGTNSSSQFTEVISSTNTLISSLLN